MDTIIFGPARPNITHAQVPNISAPSLPLELVMQSLRRSHRSLPARGNGFTGVAFQPEQMVSPGCLAADLLLDT